jgi:peptidyl-prolyl cis-trans isomerase A (cyclophilin A)
MSKTWHPLRLLLLVAVATPSACIAADDEAEDKVDDNVVRVRMTTSEGVLDIDLFADRAPLSVFNFLRYVEGGHYDGAAFYRTVTRDNDKGRPPIEVIQGGLGDAQSPWPPIAHESTRASGITHQDGTISMARGESGTAASEFFICIGAQPGLDHGALRNPDGEGFAAFGRVASGMDTVRRIHRRPADGAADSPYVEGQMLREPVRILSVRRLSQP